MSEVGANKNNRGWDSSLQNTIAKANQGQFGYLGGSFVGNCGLRSSLKQQDKSTAASTLTRKQVHKGRTLAENIKVLK